MQIAFSKYQGTGNDFILIDNRDAGLALEDHPDAVAQFCDRHFGIGADGLILLEQDGKGQLRMVYFNSDGRVGSMCGNGARCFTRFAGHLGLLKGPLTFEAYDGIHTAEILDRGRISVTMRDVLLKDIARRDADFVLDTGSPHLVRFVRSMDAVDVFGTGRAIRNSPSFVEAGINVNFAEPVQEGIRIRTFERGVEDITLSCGTGVTATALAFAVLQGLGTGPVNILSDGGQLQVQFTLESDRFAGIRLIGPAEFVFGGIVDLKL